jgi:mannose/fructose/N-acetylgalactosamine-specific phosphotransferase system component IIC
MTEAIIITILSILLAWESQAFGQFGLSNPLVAGAIVGLALGDVKTAIEVAVPLQLIFMMAVGVIAATPPDALLGTILGTTLAIKGIPIESAIALAVPVAFVAVSLNTVIRMINTLTMHYMDRLIAKGNYRLFKIVHITFNPALLALRNILVVFPAVYYGAEAVQSILDVIPVFILTGFSAAGKILPALGFGMLIKMIGLPHLMPFLFIGFVLASYLPITLIGMAALGMCFMVLYDYFANKLGNNHPKIKDIDVLLNEELKLTSNSGNHVK